MIGWRLGVEVRGGVLPGGIVATADVAARRAPPEVHPLHARAPGIRRSRCRSVRPVGSLRGARRRSCVHYAFAWQTRSPARPDPDAVGRVIVVGAGLAGPDRGAAPPRRRVGRGRARGAHARRRARAHAVRRRRRRRARPRPARRGGRRVDRREPRRDPATPGAASASRPSAVREAPATARRRGRYSYRGRTLLRGRAHGAARRRGARRLPPRRRRADAARRDAPHRRRASRGGRPRRGARRG